MFKKANSMASSPITSWQIEGENEKTVTDFMFLVSKSTVDHDTQPHNYKMLAPWKESYGKRRQCAEKKRHPFADQVSYHQNYSFSSSHVQMWELDSKKGWMPKNWCFCTVVLEKTLESTCTTSSIKPVNPKRNQPWILIGRIDAEAEAPTLWPTDMKRRLNGKDPDAGKEWKKRGKGVIEDEMVGWHHRLNGYEFEPTFGHSER